MKYPILGLVLACLSVPQYQVKAATKPMHWLAAAAAASITPEHPVWMAGYASRRSPSIGVEHQLHAKTLIIEDTTGNQIVIVTLDLIGVTPELRSAIESETGRLGIAPEALLINASHTHCGPEIRADRLLRFGIDSKYAAIAEQYVRNIAKTIGQLIEQTQQDLQPAKLVYSRARTGFAMNRRLPTEKGFINSPNPDGPIDHDVPVLRVIDQDEKVRAILFGYACHATTLSYQKLCGDYPGFAQAYLEEDYPGITALFLNGCSADQNPYPRRSLQLAQQHGRALANGVKTAMETKASQELIGHLGFSMQYTPLKFASPPNLETIRTQSNSNNQYEKFHATALLKQIQDTGSVQTEYSFFPIQAFQLGRELTLVALCGEAVVDYSIRLKTELQSNKNSVWVAGYSNHVFGYLPSKRVLLEGGYEGGGAMLYTTFPGPFDISVEQRIIQSAHRVTNLAREQSRQPSTTTDR